MDATTHPSDVAQARERLYSEWAQRVNAGASVIRTKPAMRTTLHPYGAWGEEFRLTHLGPQHKSVEGRVTVHRRADPGVFQVELLGSLTMADGSHHSCEVQAAIAAMGKELPGLILEWRQDGNVLELVYDARRRLAPEDRLYAYWTVLGEYAINLLQQNSHAFGTPAPNGDIPIPYHVDLRHEAAIGRLTMNVISPSEFTLTFTARDYPQLDVALAKAWLYRHFQVVTLNAIEDGVELFIDI